MDKRQAILNSALELFSARGYENTPTGLISKNAGEATGTLFHHFGSKEELINQLLLECKADELSRIGKFLRGKVTVEEKLRAAWEGMVTWGLENENRFLFLMQYKKTSFMKKETHEKLESQSMGLFSLYSEAVESGFIRDIPVDMMTDIMMALFEGTIAYFRKNRSHFDDPEYRENAYAMFLNAMTK